MPFIIQLQMTALMAYVTAALQKTNLLPLIVIHLGFVVSLYNFQYDT
jgi:hypothetical protein